MEQRGKRIFEMTDAVWKYSGSLEVIVVVVVVTDVRSCHTIIIGAVICS